MLKLAHTASKERQQGPTNPRFGGGALAQGADRLALPHAVEHVAWRFRTPKLWALHPYVAAAYWGTTKQPSGDQRLKDFMDATNAISGTGNSKVWLTEQGPMYAGTLGNHNDWDNGNSKLVRLFNLTTTSA